MDGYVTAFARSDEAILLVRREGSEHWDGVTVPAGDDPDRRVRAEINEVTGLSSEAVTFVRAGDPVERNESGQRAVVYPYLFDVTTREMTGDAVDDIECEWVPSIEIRRRETTANLWRAYEAVAPTVRTIATDREHGSAALSMDALRVLRDRAGVLADREGERGRDNAGKDTPDEASETAGIEAYEELAALARDLRGVRSGMVSITNRVNDAMANAENRTPSAVERSTREALTVAASADSEAAAVAASQLAHRVASDGADGDDVSAPGPRVFTLSRSGTVVEALRRMDPAPETVVIAASRPGGEGVAVGEELSEDLAVVLVTDAGIAHALANGISGKSEGESEIDAVLVGADTIAPDGRVLNKIGTRAAAIAAAYEGVPVYVVAASAKISPDPDALTEPDLEAGAAGAIDDGEANLDESNPTFDVTPGDLVTGICTERGTLAPEEVAAVAREFATRAAWDER